jgi:peptide/nickel transport system substrate-binding protein
MSSSSTKTLRVGLLTAIHHLDPRKAQDTDSMMVLRQIAEPPYLPTGNGIELRPVLFETALEQDGPTAGTLRARVRSGLVFSDGKPLTATDIVASLSKASIVEENAQVQAQGDDVIFTLKRPNARLELSLSHLQCCVHRFDSRGTLIGSGPFMMAPGSTFKDLRLVRNPHYPGVVPLDEIHFQTFSLDADGRASALRRALQNGDVDLSTALPREDISELSGVRKSFQPALSTASLFLNHRSPRLRNARIRQAIGLGLDRLEVARQCYSNPIAFRAVSLLPRGFQAVDEAIAFDRDRAKALIRQLAPPEVPKELSLLIIWAPRTYLPNPLAVAENVKQQLQELGIEVVLHTTSNAAEFSNKIIEGGHDLVLAGWTADTLEVCDFLEALLASDRIPNPANIAVSNNAGNYQSAEMDRLIREYRAERRPETLAGISRLLQEDVPLVPLLYGASAVVMSFRVLGFQTSPLLVFSLAELDLRA